MGDELPLQGSSWRSGDADARAAGGRFWQGLGVVIVEGAVSPNRVQLLVSVPRRLGPGHAGAYPKGRSSRILQDEFPQSTKRYWGQHLRTREYFCAGMARWTRRRFGGTSRKSAVDDPRENAKIARRALSRLSAGAVF
jgi:Transposase IS200 like